MNVFMQGMRRSGTTIVFDVLMEDEDFDCYYEPLGPSDKKIYGGGSGVHKLDFYEKIRKLQAAFLGSYPSLDNAVLLNYGAPRKAELEFERELPDYCRAYIKYIVEQSDSTLIKFTRMYCKVGELRKIDPTAKFIHIVRDPRSVVTSYLFGERQNRKNQFPNSETYFERVSQASHWSSYAFSERLLETPAYQHLTGCADFLRILLLWKYTFQQTYRSGTASFGEDYFLLRHEDLISEPEHTLRSIYEFLGRRLPPHLVGWAKSGIRQPGGCYLPDDPRWRGAVTQLDMLSELQTAGYFIDN